MTDKEKKRIKEWFRDNMQVHTDWTGKWVETNNHKDSVDKVAKELIEYVESKQNYYNY